MRSAPIATTIRSADRKDFIGDYPNEQVGGLRARLLPRGRPHRPRHRLRRRALVQRRQRQPRSNPVRFATAGGVEAVVSKFRSRSNDQLIEDGMAIGGNPDTVCRVVEKWAEAGMDQMIFLLQAGRTTHDQVMRSIELIGEKVIPRFAEHGSSRGLRPTEAPAR